MTPDAGDHFVYPQPERRDCGVVYQSIKMPSCERDAGHESSGAPDAAAHRNWSLYADGMPSHRWPLVLEWYGTDVARLRDVEAVVSIR